MPYVWSCISHGGSTHLHVLGLQMQPLMVFYCTSQQRQGLSARCRRMVRSQGYAVWRMSSSVSRLRWHLHEFLDWAKDKTHPHLFISFVPHNWPAILQTCLTEVKYIFIIPRVLTAVNTVTGLQQRFTYYFYSIFCQSSFCSSAFTNCFISFC